MADATHTEICLVDGTKLLVPHPLEQVREMVGDPPPSGWLQIELAKGAKTYFNPAHVACLRAAGAPKQKSYLVEH